MKLFYRHLFAVPLSLILFLVGLVWTPLAQAQDDFDLQMTSTYTINQGGQTRVQHQIIITNTKPVFFMTQYGMKISSPNLTRVVVDSNGQSLPAEVVSTDKATSIGITFPDKLVGEGKQRTLSISYDNPDASVVSGSILEVSIPKLAEPQHYSRHTVILNTPLAYGKPTRISPQPVSTTQTDQYFLTQLETVDGEAVTALFGKEQVFNLTLRYFLENPTNASKLTQIALPPDTTFQRVSIQSLDPVPVKLESDPDGNWIATYQLDPNSQTTVYFIGQVLLTLDPNPEYRAPQPQRAHTQSAPFWDTQADPIKELANTLSTPQSIYDYVTTNLQYNYNRLGQANKRLGAEAVLSQRDQALCQEFTDLFVTLTRAKNIPARRVTGYAYTPNPVLRPLSLVEDILHTWPEYYDAETRLWRPMDPTWGHTSGGTNYRDQMDLNHIVFAINGLSSETPYPGGSYKLEAFGSKDVEVTFASEFTQGPPQVKLVVANRKLSGIPIPNLKELIITNTSDHALYNIPITLTAPNGEIIQRGEETRSIESILPYQTVSLPVNLFAKSWFNGLETQVELRYGEKRETIQLTSSPYLFWWLTNPYFWASLGLGAVFITFLTWSLLVFRRRR